MGHFQRISHFANYFYKIARKKFVTICSGSQTTRSSIKGFTYFCDSCDFTAKRKILHIFLYAVALKLYAQRSWIIFYSKTDMISQFRTNIYEKYPYKSTGNLPRSLYRFPIQRFSIYTLLNLSLL